MLRATDRYMCAPTNVRGEVRIAASWTRDALDWRAVLDLSPAEALSRDQQLRAENYRVLDIAGYLDRDQSEPNRYCGVWVKRTSDDDETRLFLQGSPSRLPKCCSGDRPTRVTTDPFPFRSSAITLVEQECCGVRSNGDCWTRLQSDRSPDGVRGH